MTTKKNDEEQRGVHIVHCLSLYSYKTTPLEEEGNDTMCHRCFLHNNKNKNNDEQCSACCLSPHSYKTTPLEEDDNATKRRQ